MLYIAGFCVGLAMRLRHVSCSVVLCELLDWVYVFSMFDLRDCVCCQVVALYR